MFKIQHITAIIFFMMLIRILNTYQCYFKTSCTYENHIKQCATTFKCQSRRQTVLDFLKTYTQRLTQKFLQKISRHFSSSKKFFGKIKNTYSGSTLKALPNSLLIQKFYRILFLSKKQIFQQHYKLFCKNDAIRVWETTSTQVIAYRPDPAGKLLKMLGR